MGVEVEGRGGGGGNEKSCGLCRGMTVRWRGGEGEDTSSLAGLSGSITFGELLSTPVWQLYHRGWKGTEGKKGGSVSTERSVEEDSLSPPPPPPRLSLFVLRRVEMETDGDVKM